MQSNEKQARRAQEILARHLQLAEPHIPRIIAKLERAIATAEKQHLGAAYERARLAIACDYSNRLQQWSALDIIDGQTFLTSPSAIHDTIWTVISKMARHDLGIIPLQPGQEDRPTLH